MTINDYQLEVPRSICTENYIAQHRKYLNFIIRTMGRKKHFKPFQRAELSINKRLKNYFLCNYSHYTVPGINTIRDNPDISWDVESVLGRFEDYPYFCDLPKPLLPPVKLNREVIMQEDPALELLTLKSHMKDDIDNISNYYKKNVKDKTGVKWRKRDGKISTYLPKFVADIAEIIELDPDPHFTGTYDWYYTGGTLSNISYNDENILLFPFSGELVASPISHLKGSVFKPELSRATKCYLDSSPFYELKYSLVNNICIILGRYRKQCIFYNLFGLGKDLNLIKIHEQSSRTLCVSADVNHNSYCTAEAERRISKWDLTNLKCIGSGKVMHSKVLDDNWSIIRYQSLDPEVLIYIDRCCIHYIDTRQTYEIPAITLCPKTQIELCESLCTNCPSSNPSCQYIGTYHSLLLCDNRSAKEFIQQKWTHQFKGAPLLSHSISKTSQEIIAITSQIQRECAIILNNWINENHSLSYSLPFTPPSILETLYQAKLKGKCLDPSIKSRLELCSVGCTLVVDNQQTYLFHQNSAGDIFYQGVTHEEPLNEYSFENYKAMRAMECWENTIMKQNKTIVPLTHSEKSDMTHIFKNLKRTDLKMVRPEPPEKFSNSKWKQSLTSLASYMDILAPDLLTVWDMKDEAVTLTTAAPHQKVLNWLETADAPSNSQVFIQTQDAEHPSTPPPPPPILTQELISVSQLPEKEFDEDIEVLPLPKVKSKSSNKDGKKMKFVPGF